MTDNSVIKTKDAAPRIWQIDALRGVAIILMTVFHALVDIRDFFGFADVRYFEPPLVYIGKASAILFIFISGVSCRFSKSNIKRGVKVLLCGLIVTAATYFYVPELYIRFGILHFLGTAMILTGVLQMLIRNEKVMQPFLWVAAPLSLLMGRFFSTVHTQLPFLLVIGIITPEFRSYDYYPLFPWMGVFFAGYAAGRFVLRNRDKITSFHMARVLSPLCGLGKISLIYYLLHQPALIAVFYAVDMFFRKPLNM